MRYLTSIKTHNSLTNSESTQYDDNNEPFTLLEWVERSDIPSNQVDQYVDQYNDYIKSWRTLVNQTTQISNQTIQSTYVRFLQEIEMKYLSLEEQRYFKNVDFTDPIEADAAIVFFADRIKQIIKDLHDSRHQVKFQKIKHGLRGSSKGLKKIIFDHITNFILHKQTSASIPSIDHVIRNTRVEINEKYDISQVYYDTDYIYTSGNEYTSLDGTDYIGFFHVVHEQSGRKLYMTGKTVGESDEVIIPRGTGSLYNCDK